MGLFSIQVAAWAVAMLAIITVELTKLKYKSIKNHAMIARITVIYVSVIFSILVYWTKEHSVYTMFAIFWRGVVYSEFLYRWVYFPLKCLARKYCKCFRWAW